MKFVIEYKTQTNGSDILTYNLFDNELVSAWIDCLNNNEPCINFGFYNLQDLNVKRTAIDLADAYYRLTPKFLEKDRNINAELLIDKENNINQDVLNKLHMIYHYYQDRLNEFNLLDEAAKRNLQVLNGNIHALESRSSTPSYQFIINPTRNNPGLEIPEHWYSKYFSEAQDHGDLLLGYATVGKDLLEIYNTQDVDNLDLITPQKYVYSEFRQVFDIEKNFKLTVDDLKNWCAENGRKNLSDSKLYAFRPKLGKIDTDLNFYNLKEKCKTFKEPVGWEVKK